MIGAAKTSAVRSLDGTRVIGEDMPAARQKVRAA